MCAEAGGLALGDRDPGGGEGFAERAHALSARTTDSGEMAGFPIKVKETGCIGPCMPQDWLTNMMLR
jgi:hypothetical protein